MEGEGAEKDPCLAVYNDNFKENIEVYFDKTVKLLSQYLAENLNPEFPTLIYKSPDELKELIDFSLPSKGLGLDGIENLMKEVLKYSQRTGHIHFFNQLFQGNDIAGILGEFITAVINTTSATFEIGPVTSLIEKELIRRMCEMVGFEEGDGVFAPGGSISNLMAMILAKDRALPSSRSEGLGGAKLVCFTSSQAHYSVKRAGGIIGIGTNAVISIPCDRTGKMIPDELEKAIKLQIDNGNLPFFVSSTAATTVLAQFDPFVDLSFICKKYNIWFHIDGCQGASVLFSEKHKHLMEGSHLADSISWNPHKSLGIPLQCSAILISKKNLLLRSNAMQADYLFHENGENVSYDMGDLTLQCGRKVDTLKFWISWKAHGNLGFGYRMEKALENIQYFAEELRKRKDRYKLVHVPVSVSCCFWCIPKSIRGLEDNEERDKKIDELSHILRNRMYKAGKLLVNYQPLKDLNLPHSFRLTVHNPAISHRDIDWVISQFDELMENL